MAKLVRIGDFRGPRHQVFFNRRELDRLLSLYSRRVAGGFWRDYAIDHAPGMAVFSVFRNSLDGPVYRIAKYVDGPETTAEFLLLSCRKPVRRGRSIDEVLDPLDVDLRVVS